MRHVVRASRLALALLCGALLGCPADAPVALDPAKVDALARAFADALLACEERSPLERAIEPEGTRDLGLIESSLRQYLRALAASPRARKDPVALDACLAFLESDAVCDGLGDGDGACDRVFQGTVEGGARCALNEECRSSVCLSRSPTRCGTCAERETAGEGEFCGQRLCDHGLACNYGGETPVCVPLRQEGAPCFVDEGGTRRFYACDEGLFCAPDDLCRELIGEGEACEGGLRCGADLSCEGPEGARICRGAPDDAGAPCDPAGAACGPSLESGLACVEAGPGFACAAAVVVGDGAPCDAAPGDQHAASWCLHGLTTRYCAVPPGEAEGTCALRPAPGEPCDERAPCDVEQGTCVDGLCRAWPDEGEPCLLVEGLRRCGPHRLCDEERPGGATCVSEAPPLRLPACGG